MTVSTTTFQAANANQIFEKTNILSERVDITWAPSQLASLFRKYPGTMKFHEEDVITRKLHSLISYQLLVSTIQQETILSAYALSLFLFPLFFSAQP